MSRYKVSYGRCAKSTFRNKKRSSSLVPGRLYFIKDTGEILRASSTNTYESYTNRIHVVDAWPVTWESGNIYLKKETVPVSTGNNTVEAKTRAKIVVEDDDGNQVICELKVNDGGGGGGVDIDDLRDAVSSLQIAVVNIQDQLKWKRSN